MNRDHADLVEVTAQLIAEEAWDGYRTPEHWLVVRVGLSPARAKDIVRLARRREEIPSTIALLAQSRVSVDQAAVVARKTPTSHQASVAGVAEHLTVPQLNRALKRYVFDIPDAATDTSDGGLEPETAERKAAAAATLSMGYDDDGRFRLQYSAPAEVGALVEQAVREAKDALFTAGQTDATLADALAEIATRSLAALTSTSRRAHYRVYVHLSTDGAWVNGAGAIPPSLAAKFACDATVQAIRDENGKPVSVGRAHRIAPDRTRRLIEDRDGGCRYPGCATTGFLEIHHLRPWSKGGGTDYETNVCLCPHHHDELHRGEYDITGDPNRPDGLTFTHKRGLRIIPLQRPAALPADPRGDPPRYSGLTDEPFQLDWIGFDRDPELVDSS